AWRDGSGVRVPQVRRLACRCARLHAGDAVLDRRIQAAARQPVQPAHERALWLRDPEGLPRYRERRLLARARPVQRQPRPGRVSERGARDVARALERRRADRLMLRALRHPRWVSWFYGFTPPEHGKIHLGHRRVYIVPTRIGWMF